MERMKRRPRVASIPVDIDWRSLSLGAVLPLPSLAQGLPAGERALDWLPLLVSAGVLAGVLLALGGLIHELGHVYAARRVGLAAESIRLGFAFRATVFPGDVCLPCCRWSSRASPRSTSCSPSSFAWWPLLARQCRWENWRTRRAAGLGCRGNWYGHDAARSLAARHACAAASDVPSRDRDPAAARSGDWSCLAGASVTSSLWVVAMFLLPAALVMDQLMGRRLTATIHSFFTSNYQRRDNLSIWSSGR